MELNNLNLNLLVHLDALLAPRGVSGAAEQLNTSRTTLTRLRIETRGGPVVEPNYVVRQS
jgi:hypothetical protein